MFRRDHVFAWIIALFGARPEQNNKALQSAAQSKSASERSVSGGRRQASWPWSVILLLVFAGCIRVLGLTSQSLSMDECYERDRTEMSIAELVQDPNSFPPLYHVALLGWFTVDSSEFALRTFSFACGMTSLGVLWLMVRRLIGDGEAWWTLLAGACSPFHIFYSQQGRVYMLYMLLALLAVACFVRLVKHGSLGNAAAFITVSVLGGYVHYFFAIVLLSIGLVGMIVFGRRIVLGRLLPCAAVIGVLCSPLLLLVFDDLNYQLGLREPRPLNAGAIGYTYFSLISGYSLGISRAELHAIDQWTAFKQTLPWLLSSFAIAGTLVGVGIRGLRHHWSLGLWVGLLTVPIMILLGLCIGFGVTYNTRFLVWLWIPGCVLIGAGLHHLNHATTRSIAFLSLAMLFAVAIYNRQFNPRYMNEDVRAAANFVRQGEQQPILVCSAYMRRPLQYYLGSTAEAIAIGPAKPGEAISPEEAEEYRQVPIWLVYCREFHGDPDGSLLRRFTGKEDPSPAFSAAGVQVFACQPTTDHRSVSGN